jgi:hypothetical protein
MYIFHGGLMVLGSLDASIITKKGEKERKDPLDPIPPF